MGRRQSSTRAYGVLVEQGQVLLVRSSNPHYDPPLWWLPGGGIDFGETPEEALAREFVEETGLVIGEPQLLGVGADTRRRDNGDQVHTVRITYRVTRVGGELTDELEGTTDRARWFELEGLEALRLAGFVLPALALAQSAK